MNVEVLVNNVPFTENIEEYQYLVIRLCEGELWYYGADNDYEECKQVVFGLGNAFIVRNPVYKEM